MKPHRVLIAVPAILLALLPAAAQTGDDVQLYSKKGEIPDAVAKQVDCGTEPEAITRKPFAGGHIFLWQCASNHANWIDAVVHAPRADGTGARLLTFPSPGRRKASTELSNIEWFAARNELASTFVDPETRFCRTEGRWRLAGTPPLAQLIFWRETRDCNGKRGWRTVVDRRR